MRRLRKALFLVLVLANALFVHAQSGRTAARASGSRNQATASAIQKLEEEMRIAALKGEAGWWDTYLADNFTDVDSNGTVRSKAQVVGMYRSGQLAYDTFNLSDRTVRIFGDTAIVTGKMTIEATYQGHPLSGDFQFTRVWISTAQGWQLVASQITRIAS